MRCYIIGAELDYNDVYHRWRVVSGKERGNFMVGPINTGQAVLKYDLEVMDHGRLELAVPFAPGARVVVYVFPEIDESVGDLAAAAGSSLLFWDNPLDDEDWNDA